MLLLPKSLQPFKKSQKLQLKLQRLTQSSTMRRRNLSLLKSSQQRLRLLRQNQQRQRLLR